MSFYDVVRKALMLRRQRGVYATAKFLKSQGVCTEDRRKVLGFGSKAMAPA